MSVSERLSKAQKHFSRSADHAKKAVSDVQKGHIGSAYHNVDRAVHHAKEGHREVTKVKEHVQSIKNGGSGRADTTTFSEDTSAPP